MAGYSIGWSADLLGSLAAISQVGNMTIGVILQQSITTKTIPSTLPIAVAATGRERHSRVLAGTRQTHSPLRMDRDQDRGMGNGK